MSVNISGADVRTPRAAARLFTNFATAYRKTAENIDWFKRCQLEDGVPDGSKPIVLLTTMHEQAIIAMRVMEDIAARALKHADHLDRTVGTNQATAGSQKGGGYTDVAAR